jgi:hypothetical protein
VRNGLETVALAWLAIVCCAGLSLLLAAGVSATAVAWIGGITLGVIVFTGSLALLAVRARRRSASQPTRR